MHANLKILLGTALTCALAAGTAYAAEPTTPMTHTMTPQQQRMSDCNKNAVGKTGEVRKTYMSECLHTGATPVAHKTSQQQKMTTCNSTASMKHLKGTERQTFMSTCLKAPAEAAPTPVTHTK